eukprot:scaffold404_cov101-Isochrysis_galbana.AAC.2
MIKTPGSATAAKRPRVGGPAEAHQLRRAVCRWDAAPLAQCRQAPLDIFHARRRASCAAGPRSRPDARKQSQSRCQPAPRADISSPLPRPPPGWRRAGAERPTLVVFYFGTSSRTCADRVPWPPRRGFGASSRCLHSRRRPHRHRHRRCCAPRDRSRCGCADPMAARRSS